MKCPKCNYISFDYNQACPKCKRDLAEVREKMNLPDFRPSLLPFSSAKGHGPKESISLEKDSEFAARETAEMPFLDSDDFDVQFGSGPGQSAQEPELDFSLGDESDELTLDFDDLAIDDSVSGKQTSKQDVINESQDEDLDFSLHDETDGLSLEFDEFEIGGGVPETSKTDQEINGDDSIESKLDLAFEGEETEAFDLGDVALEEPDEGFSDDEAQVTLNLDESVSVMEERVGSSESFSDKGGNIPSDLEVLDLDLDLEETNDK